MRRTRIVLDCGQISAPTATTVDQIARLQLAVRRCGCRLELEDTGLELAELIGFCGLGRVLGVETRRQAEQGKHLRSVEKERELDDPSGRELEHL